MTRREKLTLRLEEEMIEKAKRFARDLDTSVSRMVAGFFDSLEETRSRGEGRGRITKRLRGSLVPDRGEKQVTEEGYLRYLEEKHG